ncbi:MAG TPA: signal peptide peptidase SppA [Candidatus Deferrimicrobiaceae bacterium]|nr:signal peptide peptidase SppA [Candidatus Deferrimicrobiaceae bacterium]
MTRKILVGFLAVIGGLVILGLLAYGGGSWIGKKRVPAKTVLEVDLERGLVEYVPDDPVARYMLAKPQVLLDVVDALSRASDDDRVVALVARVGTAGMGMAQIQEVRDAVLAFRSQGKPAIAYGETFGEFGPGNAAYYLATAFDEIYLQPSGDVSLTGLIFRSTFLRGTLDRLGVNPRVDHRQEYKSLKNLLTERKYTKPHREASRRVMESMFGQIVKGISEARNLSVEEVQRIADRGPLLGKEAADAKLVDGLAYRDEVYARMKEKAGGDAEYLSLSDYLCRAGRPHREGATVALIYGVGSIRRGASRYHPALGRFFMGPDTVAAAFRSAIEDEEVKAILFRVDSPGGSYVASDTIWRETVRAREAGKPVIVSMGNAAASGGYMVSMAANRIVAQPATVTGSIGVFAGKMVTSAFWEKVGVSFDEVHTSENATLWTATEDYTPAQWATLQKILDRIYDDFTAKTARGRNLPRERVLEIAKGRAWTGEDAKSLGLVDELGGISVALRLAREAAGISEGAPIRLKAFPERKPLWKRIWEKRSSVAEGTAAALLEVLELAQPIVREAGDLGLAASPGVQVVTETEHAPE